MIIIWSWRIFIATNIAKESVRLTEVEERLESEMEVMNDRIDSAVEKIIQSSVSYVNLLDTVHNIHYAPTDHYFTYMVVTFSIFR